MLAIPDYHEMMKIHAKVKHGDVFRAFREYTGKYGERYPKGTDLPGAGDMAKSIVRQQIDNVNPYRPFDYFGKQKGLTAVEVYENNAATALMELPYSGKNMMEIYIENYVKLAPRLGVVPPVEPSKLVLLFFCWLANVSDGVEAEGKVLDLLKHTDAARRGWVFTRASNYLETQEVDILGQHPDGRDYYISVKTAGSFTEKSINEYRIKQEKTKPDIYINEKLQARRPGSLGTVEQLK